MRLNTVKNVAMWGERYSIESETCRVKLGLICRVSEIYFVTI